MTNKYLVKIASTYDHETLSNLGNPDISKVKDITPKALGKVSGRTKLVGGLSAAALLGGVGYATYKHNKDH